LKAQFDKAYGPILQYVPDIEVVFADVADMSEADIGRVANAWLQAALLTWKYSHDPVELLRRLAAILRLISRGRAGNFFTELVVYVISLINIPEEEMMEALDSLPPDIKQNMMSTYDMILQKGRKEGKQEGKLEGLEEVVLRGHKNGLSIDTLSAITGLPEKEVEGIIAKYSRKKNNRS
jgi:predicted transposase/invertase (TIGR01784 family)